MYKIIGTDQKEYGPVSADQIRRWIAEGRVNSQTKVKGDSSADWQLLGALPEFASAPSPLSGAPPILPEAAQPKTSGLAVTSLVFGVLGFCGITALIGLILGIIAVVRIKASQGRLSGRGLAIAGIAVSAFMLLICIPIASAQTPTPNPAKTQNKINPDKEKSIRQLLEVMGTERLTQQMTDQMLVQMRQAMRNVPEEIWSRFQKKIDYRELIDQIVPVYDRHYTKEDIDGLIAFFRSPVGQKFVGELPQVTQESGQIGQAWGRQKAQEVINELEKERTANKKVEPRRP